MIYKEYHSYKEKYYAAQKKCDEILREKEELFQITQPKAVNLDKERVSGGENKSPFDIYLSKKEKKRIDERLNEANNILNDRKLLLEMKEQELRSSKDWIDIVYVYYYLEKLSVKKIEKRIPYSDRQIFRFINEIKNNI